MNKKFFKVADHVFGVEACDELLSQMSNYEPFEVDVCDACCENPVFSLVVQEAAAPNTQVAAVATRIEIVVFISFSFL